MELVTGRKPVDREYGDNNIAGWISTKLETGLENDILDPRLSRDSNTDIIKVLRVAIACTHETATVRPQMNEVIQQLLS